MALGFRDREGGSVVRDGLGDGGVEELPGADGPSLALGDGHDYRQDVVGPGRPVSAPGVQPARRGGEAGLSGRVEVGRRRLSDDQLGMVTRIALGPVVSDGCGHRLDHRRQIVRGLVRGNNST